MLFTELQNSAVFKSYHILMLGNLIGLTVKKERQFECSGISHLFELFLQFESNFAEICNRASTHRQEI